MEFEPEIDPDLFDEDFEDLDYDDHVLDEEKFLDDSLEKEDNNG